LNSCRRKLFNIECFLVSRWLEPYFDGELGRRRSTMVQAHAARCPLCCQRLQENENLRAALKRAAALAPKPGDFEDLWARLSSRLPQTDHLSASRQWFRRLERMLIPLRLVWVPAALALVLAAAFGIIWRSQVSTPESSNAVVIDYIESQHSSVMIVQPQNPGYMTVIWIFDEDSGGPAV
jgi:anti-sigma factor RsiW